MRRSHERRLPSWLIGLVLIVVLVIASVLAYTKTLPWSDAYEVHAVFESAQGVRPNSPVRIAGVNVGKVSSVEALASAESEILEEQTDGEEAVAPEVGAGGSEGALVTMELEEDALPLHADATMKLRPRLFLEGNYFIDVQPGSPGADEVDEGHTFAVNRTSYTPQLDEVLTTLQGDVRTNLRTFLDEFGDGLIKHGGAAGLREFWRTSGPAGKFTSQVNEAVLGTHPGDLGGVIRGLDRVLRGLGQNEETLANLVTDFNTVSSSFAAEDIALGEAIERLPAVLRAGEPALTSLNDAFPQVRAFAREALPGVESTPETLQVATPFIVQLRNLVSPSELRGLVADLRPTVPELAALSSGTVPFLGEARALSSCFNEVIIPWANDEVEPVDPTGLYPHDAAGRVFEETGYVMTGLAGIGRNGDANAQWGRVLGQSGTNIVDFGEDFALLPQQLLGTMPAKGSSAKTQFTDDHPCERQEQPSLQAGLGTPPTQSSAPDSARTAVSDEGAAGLERLTDAISALADVEALREDGERAEAKQLLERGTRALGLLGITGDLEAFMGGDGE